MFNQLRIHSKGKYEGISEVRDPSPQRRRQATARPPAAACIAERGIATGRWAAPSTFRLHRNPCRGDSMCLY